MNERQENFSGTGEVRAGQEIDAAALDAWMRANVEDYAGPLTVSQFKGGQSNPTYKLTTPRANYVLRRKPPGQLLPSAHAVDREYKVITALHGQGFPAPRTFGLCTDTDVLSTMFYVMDCVDGRVIWDGIFPDVSREDRPKYFDAMNATIAQLHMIDVEKAGCPISASPAITSPGRSAAGRNNIWRTPTPGASPLWTGWSNGCRTTFRPATRSASSMAITAAIT